MNLDVPIQQQEFAQLVGVSESAVSYWLTDGVLPRGGTGRDWLLAYVERLREQAAGRDPTGDLTRQRARLAKEQADAVALKNQVARGEYAPIGLLADTLAAAAAGVVDRMDQLDARISQVCPGLPDNARQQMREVLALARNSWISDTRELIGQRLADMCESDEDPEQPEAAEPQDA